MRILTLAFCLADMRQILESLIKFRWKILPREQCQAIKTYIVGLVIKLSQTDELLQREKLVLAKLNDVLVQVRPPLSANSSLAQYPRPTLGGEAGVAAELGVLHSRARRI